MSSADKPLARIRIRSEGPPGQRGLPGPPGTPVSAKVNLEFSELYPSTRTKVTYGPNGLKTKIDVYDLATSQFIVFTKTFEYNEKTQLVRSVTNYWLENAQLVRTVTYDNSGNIVQVDKAYTGPD